MHKKVALILEAIKQPLLSVVPYLPPATVDAFPAKTWQLFILNSHTGL
jgi:hypothetical protein